MKKILFFVIFSVYNINAQVGVNNADPKSSLDITSVAPNSPSANEGLLLPRINAFPTTNPGADQNAMMVYLNVNLASINISGTAKDYASGYYYWDNAQTDWISFLGEKGWSRTGDNVSAGDFIGTMNNVPFNIHVFNNKRLSVTTDGQLVHHNPTTATLIGNATAGGTRSVAIGESATANTTVESVVIGNDAEALGDYGVAIGDNTEAQLQGSVAVGRDATAAQQGVSIGYRSQSTATNSTAVGRNSDASGSNSAAYGSLSNSSGSNSLAVGPISVASSTNSTAVGHQAEAAGSSAIALGFESLANATQTIALGAGSNASGSQSTSIGFEAIASGSRAIAIGYQSEANNSNSVAIGNGAIVNSNNTIRLGNTSVTSVITSGVVTANSFLATASGTTYADYVFERYYKGNSKINEAYRFKSIEDTESFVKQNGHLPGVVSYDEIKSNDFKFSIDRLALSSLEKLEEQFLYITQLNKRIKDQDDIINHQEKKLKEQDKKIVLMERRLERLEQLMSK